MDLLSTAGAIHEAGCSPAQFYRDMSKYGPPRRIRLGRGYIYEAEAVREWAAQLPRHATA